MKFLDEKTQNILDDVGLLVLRVWTGLAMFFGHGLGKLLDFSEQVEIRAGFMGMPGILAASLLVFAEVFCAILIALGVATRFAAAVLLVTMLIAAFVGHAGDPFGMRELALFFATASLVLVLTGPGRISFDHLIKRHLS